jgi:LmbE family N-acetylglucosaminyl deacetylase
VATYVLTATRAERGGQGIPTDDPGPHVLGRIRKTELRAALQVLGVRGLTLLGLCDSDAIRADAATVISQIACYVRQIRPYMVVTFGFDGATGHPDHIVLPGRNTCDGWFVHLHIRRLGDDGGRHDA